MLDTKTGSAAGTFKSPLEIDGADVFRKRSDPLGSPATSECLYTATGFWNETAGQFEVSTKAVAGNDNRTSFKATPPSQPRASSNLSEPALPPFATSLAFHNVGEVENLRFPLHVRGTILLAAAVLPWIALYALFSNLT